VEWTEQDFQRQDNSIISRVSRNKIDRTLIQYSKTNGKNSRRIINVTSSVIGDYYTTKKCVKLAVLSIKDRLRFD